MSATTRVTGIILPTRIDRLDAISAIARVERALIEDPLAHFMIGAVSVGEDTCHVAAAGCDFDATHWVALADACLEHAAKKLTAIGVRDLLLSVENARAALDFEDNKHNA